MRLTLFCLPCAGGSAAMYMRWRRSMPSHIDVVPLELPGRGSYMGQAALRDFDALIDCLLPRVQAHLDTAQSQRRATNDHAYAFFGHSMGALLAYGLARRLRTEPARQQPAILFLSACSAPTRRLTDRFSRNDDASLIADLRKQNGTPAEVFDDPDLLRMTLDLLSADYDVCRSFHAPASTSAAPSLQMPLHVLAGSDDDIDTERLLAWRGESSGAFGLDWFEGDHFYLRRHEQALLANIRASFDEAVIPAARGNISHVKAGHAA